MFILSEDQISALYSAPNIEDEFREEVFFLNDLERSQILPRESPSLQIYYILLLGYFKIHPIRLDVDQQFNLKDYEFIKSKYFPNEAISPIKLTANQKYKIYAKIFNVVSIKKYDDAREQELKNHAFNVATIHYDPLSLFEDVFEWLRVNDVEIPSYRQLQLIVSDAFNQEKKRITSKVDKLLSARHKLTFHRLLRDKDAKAIFNSVRYESRDFSVSSIKEELKTYEFLSDIFEEVKNIIPKLGISQGKIGYFAGMLTDISISRLKIKGDQEVNLYFLCFVLFRFNSSTDYLADALLQCIKAIDSDGTQYANERVLKLNSEIDDKIGSAAVILSHLYDHSIPHEALRERAFKLLAEKDLKAVVEHMLKLNRDKANYYWEYVDKCKGLITNVIRSIVLKLHFVDAADNGALFAQLDSLKEDLKNIGEVQRIDNRLVRKTKKFIYDTSNNLLPVRGEFSIYRLISSRLQKSHWYVEGGATYQPLAGMLVSDEEWEQNKKQMILNVNSAAMNTPPEILLRSNMGLLNERLERVARRIQSGENESVILEEKGGKYSWTVKRAKGSSAVNNRFFAPIPRTDISTVIYTAASSTGFFDEIKHLTGKKKSEDSIGVFIACLIANATRQGVYKMADLCEYSHDSLLRFQSNFLKVENLRKASDIVANATAKLSIFKHYNYRENYIHGSADGQKLNSRKSTKRMRFSSKYFGKGKGFFAHTLLVNNVPINVKLSSLNSHESHNIYDLMYNNSTKISVDAISTDTHGANRINYALLGLKDWDFEPRYANIGSLIESLFTIVDTPNGWTLQMKEPFDEKKILEGWDYVQRIMVSLQQKNISQSDLVAKLSRASPSDRSLYALREYDRLLKAIYVLDYMDNVELRRYIQTVLNRGEAYHQIQRAFEKVGGGKGFRGNSDKEIDMWYECSRLMANCIIYFNAVILSYTLETYERQGKMDLVKKMGRISPVAWSHIIMGGKYRFDHLRNTPDLYAMVQQMVAA